MARARPRPRRRRSAPTEFFEVRALNPAPPVPRAHTNNPSVRYTAVAVDRDGDGRNDEAVIVRGGRRDDAVRAVAQDVDPDAWIDLQDTRTFPTKHEAQAHGRAVAPQIRELARRVARGGR